MDVGVWSTCVRWVMGSFGIVRSLVVWPFGNVRTPGDCDVEICTDVGCRAVIIWRLYCWYFDGVYI